jgi:hypothetical protein
MARIPPGIKPYSGHSIAKGQGHGFAGKSTVRDALVPIDRSENWAAIKPRGDKPAL